MSQVGVDHYYRALYDTWFQTIKLSCETPRNTSKLQIELNLVAAGKTSQEEVIKHHMSELKQKARKYPPMARRKIRQLIDKKVSPQHKHECIYTRDTIFFITWNTLAGFLV